MKKLNLQEILANTTDLKKEKKVWYVAIVWRPNVWKSTFINALLWEKVSITTNVPQTTRKKILAIYNDDESQIIFFDNPGIHKSEKIFNKEINNEAISSLKDAEAILYFIDSSREGWEEEKYIKELLEIANKPVIKVFTKSDLKSKINIPKNALKISSTTKEGFHELIEKIKENLKTWQILFGEDFYTKQSLNFRISEIIREKAFLRAKEELPHSIFIGVEEIVEEEKIIKIVAYIYVETDSQKYIVIWKAGSIIQAIWKEARLELEEIFWKKVFLALRVKVQKNWRKNEKLIKKMMS